MRKQLRKVGDSMNFSSKSGMGMRRWGKMEKHDKIVRKQRFSEF